MTEKDDAPWLNLSLEEIQQLRTNKQQLTEYGKQKIRELMNLRFYDKGKETLTVDDSSWGKVQTPEMKLEIKEMTHEEMLEEAAKREAANEVIVAKVSDEDLEKVMDAAKRQELAKKSFEELTRDEKIKLALEEVDWIVIGGQDGQEFYGSIQFIRKVLKSLA